MHKDGRNIYAGNNEFHRWGHRTIEKVRACLEPNEQGFYSIAADGGRHWTFGTSIGKYGEFARIDDVCFSVNKGGYIWAKEGTEKAEAFKQALEHMIERMREQ